MTSADRYWYFLAASAGAFALLVHSLIQLWG
jgi:hypothetical protein